MKVIRSNSIGGVLRDEIPRFEDTLFNSFGPTGTAMAIKAAFSSEADVRVVG